MRSPPVPAGDAGGCFGQHLDLPLRHGDVQAAQQLQRLPAGEGDGAGPRGAGGAAGGDRPHRGAAACCHGQGWSGTRCSPKHRSAGTWLLGRGCWEGRGTKGRSVRQLGRLGNKTCPRFVSSSVPPAVEGSFRRPADVRLGSEQRWGGSSLGQALLCEGTSVPVHPGVTRCPSSLWPSSALHLGREAAGCREEQPSCDRAQSASRGFVVCNASCSPRTSSTNASGRRLGRARAKTWYKSSSRSSWKQPDTTRRQKGR